jgi:integrase
MKSISQFLELYPKKNTKDVYRAGIYAFFEFFDSEIKRNGKKVTKNEAAQFEKTANEYLTLNDGKKADLEVYVNDLMRFAAHLHNKPPKTAKTYLGAIKEYLGYNGIEFTQRQLKTIRLKLPKGGVRTIENDMDRKIIQQILQHTDIKGRALFLTEASSGMRIGEALQIELDDVLPYLENNPVMISIRGEYTKTGEQRSVFISAEAKDALIEWLKVRKQYLKSAVNKNRGLINNGNAKLKILDDTRLFPFTDNNALEMWNNAVNNAGLLSIDKGTNRKQLRIHQLRKFFRSQLALGCPVDIVEALMGHEGYLTEAYRRYTKAQMAEYYLKNEHYITIAQNQSVEAIKKEITNEMNEAIKGLVVENQGLQSKNKALEDKLTRLEKVVKVVAKVAMEDPSLLPAMKDFMKD